MKRPRHWDHDGKTKRPRHTQERQADNVRRHIKGRLDKLQRTPKRLACIICGGPCITGVQHTDELRRHSNQARRRGHVPAWLISGGLGGPYIEPNAGRKGPPPFGPKIYTPRPEADRRPRSGPITNHQKFVCNTKERAEFFGHASGVRRRAPRRAAHAWQCSERRKLQGPASFGLRESGERMGAGAPVASGRVGLGRKTGVGLPRSGRTGGRGPTFKKNLVGTIDF